MVATIAEAAFLTDVSGEIVVFRGRAVLETLRRVLKWGFKNGPLFLFFKQLRNPLVVILALALLATLYLDAPVDAFVIFIALLVNVVIGFIQEFRAEKAFDALVASQEHTTVVVRDGHQTVVPTAHLVPGDVIVCEIGSIVPADARIISINGFSVSEAHLTGESTAVEKQVGVVPEKTELYEQHNMVFMGSPVGMVCGVRVTVGENEPRLPGLPVDATRTGAAEGWDSLGRLT